MKTVTVISGKGGTGKTTVTASLARLVAESGRRVVLADADVDASNLGILLRPEPATPTPFVGSEIAVVDPDACTGCGLCVDHCRYGALEIDEGGFLPVVRVDDIKCEGCAVCTLVCPKDAFSMRDRVTGTWTLTSCDTGPLVFARVGPGGENSGRLVTRVRKVAAEEAAAGDAELVLIDGPPGTGCPVISAVTGVDRVVMVTEPTPSGISDLRRVLALTDHFGVSSMVVINKADLNPEIRRSLEVELADRGIDLLGTIPYDEAIPRAQREGKLPIDAATDAGRALRSIADRFETLFLDAPSAREDGAEEVVG